MAETLRPAYRRLLHVQAQPRRACRPVFRAAVGLKPGLRFWSRPPNPARQLCRLVGAILKFHQSEPLLQPGQDYADP